MNIRPSTKHEIDRIRGLHTKAFGDTEGPVIAQLAVDLLNDATAEPLMSLVAVKHRSLIGHVLFSSVAIDGYKGPFVAFIMAPLAVMPTHQNTGVGTALIKHGLKDLKASGADLVIVLGDPAYYARFGFSPNHLLQAPYTLAYPEAWMVLELTPGALATTEGTVQCAQSLNAPQHW